MKSQLNIRVSKLCRSQISALKADFGISEGQLIELAIDRLFQGTKMNTFIKNALDMGIGEQHARFGEMSEGERKEFAISLLRQYEEASLDKDDLLAHLPELEKYVSNDAR